MRNGKVVVLPQASEESLYDTTAERKDRVLGHLRSAMNAVDKNQLATAEEMILRSLAQIQHELYGEIPCVNKRTHPAWRADD